MLTQSMSFLPVTPPQQQSSLGVHKELEGDTARTADPKRDIPHHISIYMIRSSTKAKERDVFKLLLSLLASRLYRERIKPLFFSSFWSTLLHSSITKSHFIVLQRRRKERKTVRSPQQKKKKAQNWNCKVKILRKFRIDYTSSIFLLAEK